MPIGGGEPRRITKTDRRESLPRFLPSGDLLYVVERGGRSKGSRLDAADRNRGRGGDGAGDGGADRRARRCRATGGGSPTWSGASPTRRRAAPSSRSLVHSLAAGGAPTTVTLRLGEHVLSPSF